MKPGSPSKDDRLTCVSLFAGCGGLDLGFMSAGFQIEIAVDNDPIAVKNHRNNLPSKVELMDLSEELPSIDGPVDVLLAGPPCQGFSTLGRRDPADPRNKLLDIPAGAAEVLRPRFFVLENVAGVRSGPHATRLKRSAERLKDLGYKVTTLDFEMDRFGVPQRRRRVIQLGWRGDGEFRIAEPSTKAPSIGAALERLDGVANHNPTLLPPGTRSARIARRIGQGQKLCNVRLGKSSVHTWTVPEVFGRVSPLEVTVLESLARLRRTQRRRDWGDADPVEARRLSTAVGFPVSAHLQRLRAAGYVKRTEDGNWDLTHTFNGKFRRPSPGGLAPAVDTRFGDPHYVLHPEADRPFTVREAARIQGFDDRYAFSGSLREQHRVIANAVPPPMSTNLARQIRRFLEQGL
jgi:DNA (cytosine-5)-methyltransferase 1